MATKLSLSNLIKLPQTVAQPFYKRSDLSPGIVHIGVGNFHRAHMAVYLDRLFNLGRDHDWAIVGAGVKSFDAARRDSMADQDWLTTVVELDPEGFSARVTGSMMDFCPVDQQALLEKLADPAIRIVSLTITEGGYYVDSDGGFDADHPDIAADAATPDDPKTVFGLLLAGLQRRRDAGTPPFTILSCDNLPENGHVARQSVLGLAGLISDDLRAWVDANVAFPNSMVDCITPGTSDRERQMVAEKFGIEDAQPVACEPFRQWVMEDTFPLGRPALEEVGVEFVDDVAPYETMKLRILNAGHAAIAYPGALLGHHFVHDAMADEEVVGFLTTLMRREVIPVLPSIKGVDFDAYLRMCVKRFSNPEIGDTIPRLCQDGSNRQPKFVLPTIREANAAGKNLTGLALEVALWCRYCATVETLDDPNAATLRPAAEAAKDDPSAFLGQSAIFGDLARNAAFSAAFAQHLRSLQTTDTRSVLKAYCQSA